ncbi:type II toxin-antitoxin system PemK/MazF family toxin [Sphingobium algorifonticola]|uniref:Type II toxin-antitoxin system PemK/MazF family toxin n=1 Tax=Sphingobium algorifonticola TaxID=2008318 RepID=A0A437J8S2_9SPHN|nr:type II toxin-antitoxin system PemK/MazF family toxin [Sphingobium algorifonticola]RVT41783.1 type II toxin-antitoxin system PemK/MazF family toxin [Sphingobium algorifonticola]
MPIREHPKLGTLLLCDFSSGFHVPEMTKRRPVIVISPKIANRPHLCTIVALSQTAPNPIMPYHCQIDLHPALPHPYENKGVWVKGDMVNAVGFHRLDFVRIGHYPDGKRRYLYDPQSIENIQKVRQCVLRALNLSTLTKYL